jgi:diaminopimelate epimerase
VGLRFTKMHGIGNDFVVVDWRRAKPLLDTAAIAAIADRHTGVGFDQLLSIEPARDASCAFYYGIWNTDGSPAGQCGNGVRCVAAWLYRDGALALDQDVRLESPSGPVTVRVVAADRVMVDMGEPDFHPARIPFEAAAMADHYTLDVDGEPVSIGAVSMGNPHAVVEAQDLRDPALSRLGPAVTAHPRFPAGVNTGFVHRLTDDTVELRVHERGVGWTRACGSGACAAAAVLQRRGQLGPRVKVGLPGGQLVIDWQGPGHTLWMTGPAAFVFEGELDRD